MKKIMALLLSICIVCIAFIAGCSKSTSTSQDDEKEKENADLDDSGNANTAETTERLQPDLPDELDFNGETFTFLVTGPGYGYGYYETVDIYTEEQNGETLNDAVYMRNRNIEQKLNINIAQYKSDNVANDAKNTISAGDDSYDAIFANMYESVTMAQNHLIMNIKDMPHIDLDKPWCDKNTENELSIKNKLFFTTGDISTKVKACTRMQIFNKKLVKDFELGDPYEYVKNDTWTFDVYAQMIKSVSVDVNGNGERDDEDVYGFIKDSAPLWPVRCFGERLTAKDSEGYPQITVGTDRFFNAADKVLDLYSDETVCRSISSMKFGSDFTNVYTYARSLFTQDKFLFHLGLPLIFDEFRNMESDFGLLPMPKLDANQQRYYHIVDNEAVMLSIPVSCTDPNKTGAVLEAMSAESMYTVSPAYNEILLKRKYVRDNESEFILDIVNETRTYDLCTMFSWGGLNGILDLSTKTSANLASTIEKIYDKVQKDIEKTMTAFED